MSESNHLTQHTVIDNSVECAVKTGSYRKARADFYRKLMKKVEWRELLAEAYLVAPLDNIKAIPHKVALCNLLSNMVYYHHE